MSLASYLPEPNEINACIKPEAEGASEAVLLAVHRSTPISYREVNRTVSVPTSEDELLKHVLTKNVPTGSLVVPITGISGVGKSHLVRVIDARIRQGEDASKYLVIRVPKSASLRRVVELILEPLKGTEFDGVRGAFARAMDEVDTASAAVHFRAHLIVALERHARSLEEQIRQGRSDLRQKLDHARRLSLLFDDPVTSGHFLTTVFPRLVKRAIGGADQETIDVLSGQFTEEDLSLPTNIDLDHAAQKTKHYYTQAINAFNGSGRKDAVAVLNAVVDEATRDLFKLQNAIGGKTLHEIILDIRSLILGKKELVLLIEDFAALTGIQETLSKVLIQEGVRDNRMVYATMRSVIAVTDGWTIGRETIATRAEREWIVESKISSNEEIHELTRRMVAAYLNAARWGSDALVDRYRSRGRNGKARWIGTFRAEDDDEVVGEFLAAFGHEDEVPLFPFTASAITYLANDVLREGDRLVFNPRLIINQILRRILLPARQAFEDGTFPPVELRSPAPAAAIAHWIAEQPQSLRARYQRVAVVWGNNPQELEDLADIPDKVFTAFRLPPPVHQPGRSKVRTPRPPIGGGSKSEDHGGSHKGHVVVEEDSRIGRFRAALESWVQRQERLPQAIANAIRKEVAASLNSAIDFNALRCRDFEIGANDISIPNAAGEGGVSASVLTITDDVSDTDGRLRAALLALLRLRVVYGGAADYAEYEEDIARTSNFVDDLVPGAVALLTSRVKQRLESVLAPLIMSGRVLGIADRGKSIKAVHQFLLQAAQPIEELPEDLSGPLVEWRKFQSETLEARRALQGHLFSASGCFQGDGKKVLGVDIVRIDGALQGEASEGDPSGLGPEDAARVRSLAEARVRARAKAAMKALAGEIRQIDDELGSDFDKNKVLASVRALAETISTSGSWSSERIGVGYPTFKELCKSFEESAIKESLAVVRQTGDEDDSSRSVVKAGQVQVGPVLLAKRFVQRARELVSYAAAQAQLMEGQYRGFDPATAAASIRGEFEVLASRLEALGGKTNDAG